MSDGGMTPSQFQILREDFMAMRLEFQASIRELVTREAFSDERRRVDGRFQDQGRELNEVKTQVAQEAQARVQQAQADAQAKIAEGKERDKLRRQGAWQWLAWGVTLIIGPILGAIIATVMANAGFGG